jgi:hypothetical protein
VGAGVGNDTENKIVLESFNFEDLVKQHELSIRAKYDAIFLDLCKNYHLNTYDHLAKELRKVLDAAREQELKHDWETKHKIDALLRNASN